MTRVYREHPDLPVNILRAKAFATALEEITLRIDPGELIVGNRTAGIRAGVIFPESGLKWVEQEIETLPTRPQDRFEVTQEDIAAFRNEILPFWRGRTLEDVLEAKIGDEMRAIGKVAKINQTDHAQGHICPDTPTWLLVGPRGLAEQARKKREETGDPQRFYEGVQMAMEAACRYFARYGALAETLAQSPDYDEEGRQRFLSSILTMSRQMRGLIEEMLQLARADQADTKAAFAPVDFSKLTSDALLPFEPIFFEAGLTLSSAISDAIQVTGNDAQLRQVVEILLDNAQKYSQPGGATQVSLKRHRKKHCLLTVANQGEPLSPEALKHIFERFYRADQARSRTGSFGLGLSIAETIVTQHQGKIWAESREGRNWFYVELPCA